MSVLPSVALLFVSSPKAHCWLQFFFHFSISALSVHPLRRYYGRLHGVILISVRACGDGTKIPTDVPSWALQARQGKHPLSGNAHISSFQAAGLCRHHLAIPIPAPIPWCRFWSREMTSSWLSHPSPHLPHSSHHWDSRGGPRRRTHFGSNRLLSFSLPE